MLSAFRTLILLCLLVVPAAAGATDRTILVFGDSISAGYGLKAEEGWVALLQKRIAAQGYGYRVVNASVSGETTSGGNVRLPRALGLHKPQVLVLELGANDGLRGSDLKAMRRNLERIIDAAHAEKSQVILVGMQIPPNYGPQYAEKFSATFREVRGPCWKTTLPFLPEGFADQRELFQADNLHPTAQAQPIMMETIWKTLAPLIKVK